MAHSIHKLHIHVFTDFVNRGEGLQDAAISGSVFMSDDVKDKLQELSFDSL